MNLDDDAFWETAPRDSGATLGTVPPDLAGYGSVLKECFPLVHPFEGLALMDATKPRACSILGSHLIEVSDKGEARWWQTIGSAPIPPYYNFAAPRLGEKIPASTCFAHRKCSSPQDFRLWLHIVVSNIRRTAFNMVLEALSPDNLLPQVSVGLQQVHNLHLTGVSQLMFGQAHQGLPALSWMHVKGRDNAYFVPLLRKGQVMGQVVLGWKDDAWRYGVVVNNSLTGQEFQVKHQGASTVLLRHLDVARTAAVRLYYKEMFQFLLKTALNNPTLRGL